MKFVMTENFFYIYRGKIALAVGGACILGIVMAVAIAVPTILQQHKNASNVTTAISSTSAIQGK